MMFLEEQQEWEVIILIMLIIITNLNVYMRIYLIKKFFYSIKIINLFKLIDKIL